MPADVAGGRLRLGGERVDFLRHGGESASLGARARRLDAGVERKNLGVLRERGDQTGDDVDAGGALLHARRAPFGFGGAVGPPLAGKRRRCRHAQDRLRGAA